MQLIKEKNIVIKNAETRDFLADAFYPEEKKELPLVLFAHGYKGYKDWGAWDLMAQKIAAAGYFFVKFNFSHNGTTTEKPTEFADLDAFGHNNFSKEMCDYDAVLNHFSQHPAVSSEKIVLIGHSRGGGISVLKASQDDRVKVLITLAGVSNFRYRFPSQQRFDDWQETGVMYSENKRTGQQMPHYFQFFQDFEENEKRFDIQYAAQHLEKPFLIIQGTDDDAIKDKESLLLHEWSRTSTLEMIQDANHTFGASEPWKEEQLPEWLDKATELAIDFMDENL